MPTSILQVLLAAVLLCLAVSFWRIASASAEAVRIGEQLLARLEKLQALHEETLRRAEKLQALSEEIYKRYEEATQDE
jgi:cell division protein FtsB